MAQEVDLLKLQIIPFWCCNIDVAISTLRGAFCYTGAMKYKTTDPDVLDAAKKIVTYILDNYGEVLKRLAKEWDNKANLTGRTLERKWYCCMITTMCRHHHRYTAMN